jgi:hypothetical protein
MATYKDVQEYTRGRYGWVAQSCWIAHVKELIGAPLRAPRRSTRERIKPCPAAKVSIR